jgi:predicted GNAT family acetyltransferase
MSEPEQIEVRHNQAAQRFEAGTDEGLAMAVYRPGAGVITFTHTEVPEALEGRGIGSRLARTALDYARAEGLKVRPLCPFIAGYIQRHPEYQDLVVA